MTIILVLHDLNQATRYATHLIAMKAGFPTAMLGSVDAFKMPSNYHWPTDTAENVDYDTVSAAARAASSRSSMWTTFLQRTEHA